MFLKKCADIFAPVICHLANLSFREGVFPDRFKKAQVTPLIKKAGLDPEIPANYRPISNLVTISKVLERLFLSRLKDHISQCSNFTQFQSAYRQYHSTETAMLKILNDVYTTADGQRSTCLVALDLSAAFDTLDHATIIDRSPPSHLWHRIIGHRLAHVIPYKQIAIREIWRRPVTTYTL